MKRSLCCANIRCNVLEAHFSNTQVAGLKHFEDMQQRISRAEVEQVHGIVFKAVSELLQTEGQPDADRLHCRVTGSYIRGKPMTGMNSGNQQYIQLSGIAAGKSHQKAIPFTLLSHCKSTSGGVACL